MEPSQREKLCDTNKTNNSINFKRGSCKDIEDLLYRALIYILIKLKAFFITQNDTPKMEKNSACF